MWNVRAWRPGPSSSTSARHGNHLQCLFTSSWNPSRALPPWRGSRPMLLRRRKRDFQCVEIPPHGACVSDGALFMLHHISEAAAATPSTAPSSAALPPLGRSLLLLDLDDTLVRTTLVKPPVGTPALQCTLASLGPKPQCRIAWCLQRPHLQAFLAAASKLFELGIFTASPKEVAESKVDWIDTGNVLRRRYYRCSCTARHGLFLKDLHLISPDVSRVLLVEDLPFIGGLQPDNVIPINAWKGNHDDDALLELLRSTLQRIARCAQPTSTLRNLLQLRSRADEVAKAAASRHPCPLATGSGPCSCASPMEHQLLDKFVHLLRKKGRAARKRPLAPANLMQRQLPTPRGAKATRAEASSSSEANTVPCPSLAE